MKVTKTIREYVVEKVNLKFQPHIDEVFKEYDEARNATIEKAQAVFEESRDKIIALCKENGFDCTSLVVSLNAYYINDPVRSNKLRKKKDELIARRQEVIQDILLALELGETNKNELKNVLDQVVV